MVSIRRFEHLLEQAMYELPEKVFERLNLGVGLSEHAKLNHATGSGQPAYVLGEYHVRPQLGRGIILYYGSFLRVYPGLAEQALQQQIARVLRHELTHHLEHLAGEDALAREDARRMLEL
ncbi:MAG: hypothetical protein GXY84_02870 [Clostridiales bacterium]|nr:hypothetical protein [Clostridiales bacterium]